LSLKKRLALAFLKLTGWKIEGERPTPTSFVMIAAPHTSNWDFPYLLAFAAVFDLRISWMGKHALFTPPLGWIMRALGGVPIERHRTRKTVNVMAGAFAADPGLILVVPTEGTRARVDYWKSGFYHIAISAKVPIVASYLDFGQRRGGFGPPLEPSGDVVRDMQVLRDFYAPMAGKFADQFGPVRLREEDASPTAEPEQETKDASGR
jgi:1-acyl-sn-glycerol-3-phosphate acyltransferase